MSNNKDSKPKDGHKFEVVQTPSQFSFVELPKMPESKIKKSDKTKEVEEDMS